MIGVITPSPGPARERCPGCILTRPGDPGGGPGSCVRRLTGQRCHQVVCQAHVQPGTGHQVLAFRCRGWRAGARLSGITAVTEPATFAALAASGSLRVRQGQPRRTDVIRIAFVRASQPTPRTMADRAVADATPVERTEAGDAARQPSRSSSSSSGLAEARHSPRAQVPVAKTAANR